MSDPEFFEVQALSTEGDTAGQWHSIGGNALDQLHAERRGLELARNEPDTRFRVVPWGSGPNDSEDCPPHCCCGAPICCDCGEVNGPRQRDAVDTTAGGGC